MVRMNGWEAVADALVAEGVKYVFGLPGSPVHFYFAVYDRPEITPILVRHETSGAFMAAAYARLTGEPAVCFASPGPGVANLVPGILEAWAGCWPVVMPCTSVDTHTMGMGAMQEVDQVGMFRPITKWATRVEQTDRIPWTMQRAFSLATNGKPGPIFIDLPADVALQEVEMPAYRRPARFLRVRAESAAIQAAADLLANAKSPVILAGGGAFAARAWQELHDMVELLQAPILTTPGGRGSISEDHPLALGQVGLYFTKLGRQAWDDADVILSVGSRNEELQSGGWKYLPVGAKFIQIDIDSFEMSRNWPADVPVVGDAKLVLQDILTTLGTGIGGAEVRRERRSRLTKAKAEYEKEIAIECRDSSRPIKARRIVRDVNEVFGPDTILVNENGSLDLWSYYSPYYKVQSLGDTVTVAEQTCMGFGVVGAIAAKLAKPEKNVVCVTGDGAFQMFMKELPTAVQYKAPVTWVVMNNSRLGWPQFFERMAGTKRLATTFEVQPDFVAIAHANQCYGERIEDPEDVKNAAARALKANKDGVPAVLDFVADAEDQPEEFLRFHREVWGVK